MPDTWKIIDDRVKAMGGFYDQIDKTRKRLNLTPYQMVDFDGKTKLDDVIEVTENKSANYMMRIIAGLLSSKWQTVVEGDISGMKARKIEAFIEHSLQQADEFIINEYGIAGLDTWLANHVCHTSLIGVHWMSYFDDEQNYKVHCLPLDMRWCPLVLNKWAAPVTFSSKEDLLQRLEDYQKVAEEFEALGGGFGYKKPAELKDIDNEVRDYWDTKVNELWIEKQLVFRQPNTYGNLPFVFVWAPSGFMFRDKGYLAHESPGLLYLNQGLYDQLSRQLSIDATLGFEAARPAYEREVENLAADDVSLSPPRRGESIDVEKGGRHQVLPRGDVNRAQLASRDEVSRMIDDASPMVPKTYTQPPSAVEVAVEVELLDEIQNPRIIALQMFKEKLARLIIDQSIFISGKDKASIVAGKRGRKQTFNVSDIKDTESYDISYQLMKQNKRLAIINEARALAMWGKAPMKYILRDVLSVEDPDGWMREIELEKAKAADPTLGLAEMAFRYAEEAENMEDSPEKDLKNWQSIMLTSKYVGLMRQSRQPLSGETQNIREATTPTGSSQGLVSLLGQRQANIPAAQPKGVTVP